MVVRAKTLPHTAVAISSASTMWCRVAAVWVCVVLMINVSRLGLIPFVQIILAVLWEDSSV